MKVIIITKIKKVEGNEKQYGCKDQNTFKNK